MKFCVDIDNTLLYTDEEYNIKAVNKNLIKVLNSLFLKGNIVILYTGRHWDKFLMTKDQVDNAGIFYHSLICGKPTADYYIDDKSIHPDMFEVIGDSLLKNFS